MNRKNEEKKLKRKKIGERTNWREHKLERTQIGERTNWRKNRKMLKKKIIVQKRNL